ncbi:hypothetical protein PENSPDRAFT_652876 [Peniophora sp. CONT]|nr:hypothetical protein PENSPDRAFT_652876 [Peniophora sp. CONT]
MSSYKQLEPFFDEPARLQIRNDFSSKCVLCKEHLKPGEGHCVPLLNAHKTYLKCLKGFYTKLSMPRDARNGLYACQLCAHNWLMGTDDKRGLAAFIPCEPLMVYALHALNLASDVDEASRSQTLDELFYDLANDPDATPERRKAAPFLYCYQLFPVRAKPSTSNLDSPVLSVHPSPLTYIKEGDSVDGSRSGSDDAQPVKGLNTYCIIEHDSNTGTATSKRMSLYRQLVCEDNDAVTTLWRLPMRAPGLFFGYADAAVASKSSNPAFMRLHFKMRFGRGLPVGYRMQGVPSDDKAFA